MVTAGKNFPNFFIVGAPRAGTTSLYEYLNEIPSVYMSPVKEPQYFSPNYCETDGLKTIKEKSEYLKLFSNVKDEKAVGEASTCYLWDPETPKRIHETVPEARIIILIRDPIKRAFSHYLLHYRSNFETQSFHNAIQKILKHFDPRRSNRYLHAGLYAKQVKRYMDTFGGSQVKVIVFEEFVKKPQETLQEVVDFLGIKFQVNTLHDKIHNKFKLPKGPLQRIVLNNPMIRKVSSGVIPSEARQILKERILLTEEKPAISEQDMHTLKEFYQEDVELLAKILKRKLPWPVFS